MKTNADDPAFAHTHNLKNPDGSESLAIQLGLTKRELFAAMAMQGILSHGEMVCLKTVGEASVIAADALIKSLNENPAGPAQP